MPTVMARRGMSRISPPTVTELIVLVSRLRFKMRVGSCAKVSTVLSLAGFRRFVESDVTVDADAAETGVDSAAFYDQLGDLPQRTWVGEHAICRWRGQLRTEQSVKGSIHVPAKTERMFFWNPTIVVREVFIHVDEARARAGNATFIEHSRKNRKLVNGTNRDDKGRASAVASPASISWSMALARSCASWANRRRTRTLTG